MSHLVRPSFARANCARALRNPAAAHPARAASHLAPRSANGAEAPASHRDGPRWKRTPESLRMPIRLRPVPKQPVWRVNSDDELLDRVYDAFCGRVGGDRRGRDLLPEEVKWTAVTHKSHAHGTQGFNDRLAYLGKRIVDLQTSLALLSAPAAAAAAAPRRLPRDEVYHHPSLAGIDTVTRFTKLQVLDRKRLSALAATYGLDKVVRWKPKRSDDLKASGQDLVLAHALYSLVGALAMQCGGEVAARAARERILQPLGLR